GCVERRSALGIGGPSANRRLGWRTHHSTKPNLETELFRPRRRQGQSVRRKGADMNRLAWLVVGAWLVWGARDARKREGPPAVPPLDRYVSESATRSAASMPASPGSLWSPGSQLADAARDLRASQVDDVITILVVEKASAVASGTTKTARASSTQNSVA